MTPEQLQRLEKLEKLVQSIVRGENLELLKNLERHLNFTLIQSSPKTLNSEDVSINEAGSASHVVLDDPDGWIKIGTNLNIPVYND